MKKVYILAIISLILVTPNIVFAEGEYCSDENLRDYRQELGTIDYEYVIDYEDVKNVDKDGYPVDYINVSMTGLPDNYKAIVLDNSGYSKNIGNQTAKVSGGVLKVVFYYKECTNIPLKTSEIYLPYYSKGEVKPFDDGSTTTNVTSNNIIITVGLVVTAIILFVITIFVLKKGRKV